MGVDDDIGLLVIEGERVGFVIEELLDELLENARRAIETLPVNETLITSATQDMTAAQVEMAIQEARLNSEIWSVLTPEQQGQATKLRAERKAQMEQRRQEFQQQRQKGQ